MKSNMWKRSTPRLAALPITSRFSDVPMGVPMPPTCEAKVIGMSSFDGAVFDFSATAVRIGIMRTTCGVLFMKALSTPVISSMSPIASRGLQRQAREITRPNGVSAPVASSPWLATISAQIAISASLPKPPKNRSGSNSPAGPRYGKMLNPSVSSVMTSRLDVSIGIESREKK